MTDGRIDKFSAFSTIWESQISKFFCGSMPLDTPKKPCGFGTCMAYHSNTISWSWFPHMPPKIARHPIRWLPKFQSQSPDLTYWSQRVSQKVWFCRLSSNSFFSSGNYLVLGGLLTQNLSFSKMESWYSTLLNTLTLESEKLSGTVFSGV